MHKATVYAEIYTIVSVSVNADSPDILATLSPPVRLPEHSPPMPPVTSPDISSQANAISQSILLSSTPSSSEYPSLNIAFENIDLFSSSTQSPFAPSPQSMISSSFIESTLSTQELTHAFAKVRKAINGIRFDFRSLSVEGTSLLSECNPEVQVIAPQGGDLHTISGSSRGRQMSWLQHYSVISFLMNGHLFTEYERISNMLGLPRCSENHWRDVVGWLGEHVT